MTEQKVNQYRIQYRDNTYQVVDWTETKFKQIGDYMNMEKRVVIFNDGIFRLNDIRTIVLLPEAKEPTEEEIANKENNLTEWGFVDAQTREWLVANGIDLSKGVGD